MGATSFQKQFQLFKHTHSPPVTGAPRRSHAEADGVSVLKLLLKWSKVESESEAAFDVVAGRSDRRFQSKERIAKKSTSGRLMI